MYIKLLVICLFTMNVAFCYTRKMLNVCSRIAVDMICLSNFIRIPANGTRLFFSLLVCQSVSFLTTQRCWNEMKFVVKQNEVIPVHILEVFNSLVFPRSSAYTPRAFYPYYCMAQRPGLSYKLIGKDWIPSMYDANDVSCTSAGTTSCPTTRS